MESSYRGINGSSSSRKRTKSLLPIWSEVCSTQEEKGKNTKEKLRMTKSPINRVEKEDSKAEGRPKWCNYAQI